MIRLEGLNCMMALWTGRYDLLAHREHKVLELVVTGLLNKQIADKLGTCETDVLQLCSRAEDRGR
jgi:FixJ family two-component response regulator